MPNLFQFITIGLMFFFFLTAIHSFAQTSPSSPADCKLGCTSNDVQIQNAYLSDVNGSKLPSNFVCPASGSAIVYLTLELTTKTPRVGVVIYTNIKEFIPPSTIGSTNLGTFSECFGINLNQPTNKVTFSQTFNWTCGTSVVMTDVFIGWGTGNTNFCTGTGFQCPATSSKCYALPPGQYIAVQTPIANNASATKCSTLPNGTTAVFDLTTLNNTVIGNQTNVTVEWYSDSSLASLYKITNATSYTSSSGNVYAKVISTISPYPFSTSTATLTVNPTPSVSSAASGSICNGVAQNYDITSAVSGTTYSWSRAAVTGISNTAVSNQTSDPITETLTNTTSAPVNVIYLITPTANGCTGATFTYTVTVNPTPSVNSAATGSICNGVAQNYDITSAVSGTTFSWSRAAVTGISNTAVSNQTSDPITETLTNTISAPVNVIYQITPTANGCTGATFSYTVTVNPTPSVSSAAAGSICNGIAQNYDITSAVSGTTFSWSRAEVTGISNTAVSGQTSDPITETLTNTTSAPINVIYLITPAANGCTGATFTYTVTVNPTPSVSSAATGSICTGVAQNYDITSAVSGTTFSWSRAAVTGISNAAVSNQTSDPITETLTNTTSAPVNVIYLITPTANGCTGVTFTYTVTVNPNPTASAGTAPAEQCEVASGGNDFSLAGSYSNGTAKWTVQSSTDGALGSVTNGETTTSPTVHVTGVGTVTFLLTVTSDKTPSCGDATSTVTVTVNPNPTVSAGDDFTKTCSNNDEGKNIGEANDDAFTYSWNPSVGLSDDKISNPIANPSGTTTYTVTKTNKTTGCSGTDSVTVTVNTDTPNVPTFCAVQPSLCGPSTGSVTIISPASGTGYEYSIDNGANWQSNPVFSGLEAGSVTGIKVKNSSTGCISDSADCADSSCASPAKTASPEAKKSEPIAPAEITITNKTETVGFEAYPVPFKDQLTIKYKFDYVSDVLIEMFDTNGYKVISKVDTHSYLGKEVVLDYHLNKGSQQVYIVRLTTKLGHSERKVLSSN